MDALLKFFGFPLDPMYCFPMSGRWFRIGNSGIATIRLLARIYRGIPASPHPFWLLRFRSEVQGIYRLDVKPVLCLVVERTSNRNLCILAIWLRGRCRGHLGTELLTKYATDPDDTIRKEVVRALIRMNAWSKLSEIAEQDLNPRIRRLATIRNPIEYKTRLSNFARNVTPAPVESGKQGFYVSSTVELKKWKPPKPVQLIREILERIRHLVHDWQRER